jgi:hypothetical protein
MRAPGGCVFHTRCPRKLGPVCEQLEPPLHPGAEPGHEIRCHIPVADLPRNTHCVPGAAAADRMHSAAQINIACVAWKINKLPEAK